MTSRLRLVRLAALFTVPLVLSGCSDSFNAGPMRYVESEHLTTDLKEPKLQAEVRKALADLFGNDPRHIKVPAGAGLPGGGYRLASRLADPATGRVKRILWVTPGAGRKVAHPQAGGYALYREHCLHCHGVSGAGDGPTSSFLYPRPRDYRRGMFKFTSTTTGAKPTRDDLRRTVSEGLHGTSMPAFDALMSPNEIEQVLDYLIFLSMRGETELSLIDEAAATGELPAEAALDQARGVFNKWKMAETQVVNPPVPKPPITRESVLRGRDLFLSRNTTGNKVDCTSCHGPQGVGNGPSFVSQDEFNEIVFGGDPSALGQRVEELAKRVETEAAEKSHSADAGKAEATRFREAWKNSLDDWGMPLRPANLNRGVYKGGRRPIDLYWRIAKGINGSKMPAHFPTLEPERIWDLVNFILALPEDRGLLEGATLPESPVAPIAPAVARR